MNGSNLPPFMGYLPPVVDGTLLELMNMSYPDYPPSASSRDSESCAPVLPARGG